MVEEEDEAEVVVVEVMIITKVVEEVRCVADTEEAITILMVIHMIIHTRTIAGVCNFVWHMLTF